MIYLKFEQNGTVSTQHFMPFDERYGLGKTREELEAEGGVFVDSVPEPENQPGKAAVLKYSEADGLYYEYVDRPLAQDEEIELLKKQNASLMLMMAELQSKG
jgi:hypothetical protein